MRESRRISMSANDKNKTNNTIGKARRAVFYQELFQLLIDNGGSMSRQEVLKGISTRLKFSSYELGVYEKSGRVRWQMTLDRNVVAFQVSGWLTKEKGVWSVTPEGRANFEKLNPTEFFAEATERYKQWAKTQPKKQATSGVEDDEHEVADELDAVASMASASDAAPTLEEIDAIAFATRTALNSIVDALTRKRAVVLQGSPGTGKTFLAQMLAHHYAGSMDRVWRVQFHPAYSYEDFVRGIRPNATGFSVEDGPLVAISEAAKSNPEKKFVLLIDEINRGNVAKILGEALSLIEFDKRDRKHAVKLGLARSGSHDFWIPPNVAVLAMMNTADRSIALVDFALRRRFAFIRLEPGYARPAFAEWLLGQFGAGKGKDIVRRIVDTMTEINKTLGAERAFGEGYAIGHSFFCSYDAKTSPELSPERWMASVFEQEIEPLIDEYCVDHPKVKEKLFDVIRAHAQ